MRDITAPILARISCNLQLRTGASVCPSITRGQVLRSDARHVRRNRRWTSTSTSALASAAASAASPSQSKSISQLGKRQWSTPLAETLAKYIATTGPISLAAYMRQCLTSSEGGYYMSDSTTASSSFHHTATAAAATTTTLSSSSSHPFATGAPTSLTENDAADQFGIKGDFITSPEISQVFGELVGVWIVAEWLAQGGPESISRGGRRGVQLIELGPGRGTLMDDMLRAISTFKQLWSVLDTIYLVEASPSLREKQRQLLCGSNQMTTVNIGFQSYSKLSSNLKIVWVEDFGMIPEASDTIPFIVAHEFFDALPIHAFQSIPSVAEENSVGSSPNQKQPPHSSLSKPMTSGRKSQKESPWRELLVTTEDLSSSPSSSSSSSKFKSKDKASEKPEFQLILSKQHTSYSKVLPNTSQRYKALEDQPGSVIEISPEAFKTVGSIAQRIGGSVSSPSSPTSSSSSSSTSSSPKPTQESSGAALILDYGPLSTIPANSLRGIRSHQRVSPFTAPGTVDISADVDFTGLADTALDASPDVEVHGPVSQAVWLKNMGGKERVEALMKTAMATTTTTTTTTTTKTKNKGAARVTSMYKGTDTSASISMNETADLETQRKGKRLMDAWLRLIDEGPQGMGRLYKVMAIVPHTNTASDEGDGKKHEMRALAGFGDG